MGACPGRAEGTPGGNDIKLAAVLRFDRSGARGFNDLPSSVTRSTALPRRAGCRPEALGVS